MNVVIKDEHNHIIKKHELLVRNARYSLSELSMKTISILISMVNNKDEDFKEYSLKISEFKELIGSNSQRTYEYVDKMTDELMSKTFKIDGYKYNWTIRARHEKGDTDIGLQIHPDLKPYLLNLKTNFIQYDIKNILRLKSSYQIRLYELFKDKWETNKRYKKNEAFTFEISIEDIREMFEIPESYQYSSGIKKRIIEKAKTEFQEKTDIQFNYEEIKSGKKVDKLLITIDENIKGSNDYISSKRKFIKYVRLWYVNEVIIETKNSETGKHIKLSVDNEGKLFDIKGERYDSKRSDEMWTTLYSAVKTGKLVLKG